MEPETFETRYRAALQDNLKKHREKVWERALADLDALHKQVNSILESESGGVLGTALLPKGAPSGFRLYQFALVTEARKKVLGILDGFQVRADGQYPLVVVQFDPRGYIQELMQLGDREALEMRFLAHVSEARTRLIQEFTKHAVEDKCPTSATTSPQS